MKIFRAFQQLAKNFYRLKFFDLRYSLLRDLVAPNVPGTLKYDPISELLTSHFQPRRLVIAKRFHFHKRVQAADESIAEFDAALQNLATLCEFGGTLEEALRDRFVCALRNEATQRKLLTVHDLIYQKALETAKGMEAVEIYSISLKTREMPINKVPNRASPGTERKTFTAVVRQAQSRNIWSPLIRFPP